MTPAPATETKHTPGPWEIDAYDPTIIIGSPVWPCNRNGFEGCWDIAQLDDLMGDNPGEVEANARLIAAAPDLLEALQNAAGFMDTPISRRRNAGDSFYEETVRAIRAAIGKAVQS